MGRAPAAAGRRLRDRRARQPALRRTHRGAGGYVALMRRIGALFELGFELDRVDAVGEDAALLRMVVTFTARSTRRSVAMPVLELLTLRADRIAPSKVFLKDTAGLLAALETYPRPPRG